MYCLVFAVVSSLLDIGAMFEGIVTVLDPSAMGTRLALTPELA